MKIRIVKLLNLIRFRIIGTIFLAITITGNAIEATAPNVDYRFIIPILVMGGVLLTPLIVAVILLDGYIEEGLINIIRD